MPDESPTLHIESLGLKLPGVEPEAAQRVVAEVGERLAERDVPRSGALSRLDVRIEAPESPEDLAGAIADGIVRALTRRER